LRDQELVPDSATSRTTQTTKETKPRMWSCEEASCIVEATKKEKAHRETSPTVDEICDYECDSRSIGFSKYNGYEPERRIGIEDRENKRKSQRSNYCNLSERAEFEWDGQNLEILEYGSEAFEESNDCEAHLSQAMVTICKVLSTPVAIIHNVESIHGAQRSDSASDDAAYQKALADVKAYASAMNLEPRELYLSVLNTNNPISCSEKNKNKKWQQKGDCSIISTIRIINDQSSECSPLSNEGLERLRAQSSSLTDISALSYVSEDSSLEDHGDEFGKGKREKALSAAFAIANCMKNCEVEASHPFRQQERNPQGAKMHKNDRYGVFEIIDQSSAEECSTGIRFSFFSDFLKSKIISGCLS
jgi:hypothetical protein